MTPSPTPDPARAPAPIAPGPDRPRPGIALALGAALLALSGCASEPERAPAPEPLPQAGPPPTLPQASAPPPSVEVRPAYRGPWEDPSSPLFNRTVYFDYDSSAIKPEYIGVMRNHGTYLSANPGTRVTLEGHTDERGTREYNLALSDQRAEAVRKFMTAEGVNPDQLGTLSYGEERPAALGHGDAAWARNRRVIIQY